MSTDWQLTADERIQIRAVHGTPATLPVRTYSDRYNRHDPGRVVVLEPLMGFGFIAGHQTRIRREEEAVPDGWARCSACRKVFRATNAGEPWKHKCEPGDEGWVILRGLESTPALAEAKGRRKLGLDVAEQTVWNVGDGKKKVA